MTLFNWSSRPEWVHLIVGFALWFILETLYYKLSIHLLNNSEIELFPKYKNDTSDNLWPISKRVLEIKDLLRKEGFKSEETLKAQIVAHITIRQAVFFNKDQTIRLNILFIPNAKSDIQIFYSLFSLKSNGEYLITDNQNLPFGGFYPDHWTVNRFPICHSLKKLLKKHQESMKAAEVTWSQFEGDIQTNTNRLQLELEQKNRKMGFLNERIRGYTSNFIRRLFSDLDRNVDACLFGQNAVLTTVGLAFDFCAYSGRRPIKVKKFSLGESTRS